MNGGTYGERRGASQSPMPVATGTRKYEIGRVGWGNCSSFAGNVHASTWIPALYPGTKLAFDRSNDEIGEQWRIARACVVGFAGRPAERPRLGTRPSPTFFFRSPAWREPSNFVPVREANGGRDTHGLEMVPRRCIIGLHINIRNGVDRDE